MNHDGNKLLEDFNRDTWLPAMESLLAKLAAEGFRVGALVEELLPEHGHSKERARLFKIARIRLSTTFGGKKINVYVAGHKMLANGQFGIHMHSLYFSMLVPRGNADGAQ